MKNSLKSKAVIKVMTPQGPPVAERMKEILAMLGEDPSREGLVHTPERYEKAMRYLMRGYQESLEQIVNGATDNLAKYTEVYGTPMTLPKPPQRRPTIAEIYENFKLSDDIMSGAYANSVMIGHSPAEFFFDFITGFYPTAAVSSRIMTAAPHMPRIVDTLKMALQQYRNRYTPPAP